MAKRLFVRIDIRRLRENMSREEGRAMSETEVRKWLADAGFQPLGDGWLINEPDLGQLEPSEVSSVEDAPDDAR